MIIGGLALGFFLGGFILSGVSTLFSEEELNDGIIADAHHARDCANHLYFCSCPQGPARNDLGDFNDHNQHRHVPLYPLN